MRNNWSDYESIIANIEGYLSHGEPECLHHLANICPDGNIVEIGTFKGKSSCCLATGIGTSPKHLHCIDLFQKQGTDEYKDYIWTYSVNDLLTNVSKCGVSDKVTPWIGSSDEIALTWNKPISLLFVDGSHIFENAKNDVLNYYKWLVPGGILALHDVPSSRTGAFVDVYDVWHSICKPLLINTNSVNSLSFGYKP